ncbi:MAG: acyl-CoA dehydrogenase C-terminal domain-containing protein [Acetobacteraceae bacterium]|nr:acyl-CoA dehydrogenase C-terminal domain-containing protein [Acetobacteraceae bacterium]
MAIYQAPLRDMRFVLHELLDSSALSQLPGYEQATPDLIDAVLEQAAKLAESELFPLNLPGDAEGCHFENGVVRTPKGFKEAYRIFREGGWTALACDPDYGGQGMPHAVNFVVEEMISSANLSFGMYPGLSAGAYRALYLHAEDWIKQQYLPKLVDGTWTGTMCLTEAQCGTDLGLIRTRADPADDGSYRISGTKIFISAGEHDLSENILHLVLAKLPDAPSGTRGISLFLVPKFLPGEDGRPGPRNGVSCGSIEHKMGIKASATCVLNFDGAKGWLVGGKHQGMRCMFTMMNAARLGVGLQGLGVAATAYQSAASYAKERRQGRSLSKAQAREGGEADPIIVHPDVRRLLLEMRAVSEASRALAYWVGMEIDQAERNPDESRRQEAEDLVALLTPVIKAALTDHGFEAANNAVQVLGGHGYIHEWGVEQLVRDARITQIYEGTNGVQALDLVGRKLGQDMGRLLRRFFHPVAAFLAKHANDAALAAYIGPTAKAFGRLQQATLSLAQKGMANPEEAGAAATDYSKLFALVAWAFMWCRMAAVANAKLAQSEDDTDFYKAKLDAARFFMARVLPRHSTHFQAVMAGSETLMRVPAESF